MNIDFTLEIRAPNINDSGHQAYCSHQAYRGGQANEQSL
ncbi:MAG: hypothetical protein RL585_2051, partial [Pseudomonadota bacterium]